MQYVASDKTVGLLDGFALVTTQHNTGNSISIGVDDVIARFPWAGYFLFSGLLSPRSMEGCGTGRKAGGPEGKMKLRKRRWAAAG